MALNRDKCDIEVQGDDAINSNQIFFDFMQQMFSCLDNIPFTVTPAEVDDLVTMEDEIEDAVKKLSRNRSGGAVGVRAEHLKGWLAASNR